MKLKKRLIFTILMFVLNILAAQETKTVVAIAGFNVKNVPQDEVDVIFEVFVSEFAGLGKCKVVDRTNVDAIIEQYKFQESDWSNTDKVAQLGNALNANMVITGQLMAFKGSLVATFRMMNVNSMEIVATSTERVSGTDDLFGKLNEMAKKLAKSINSNGAKTYEIGDVGPGGGIVFYVSEVAFPVHQPNGGTKMCNYLEVSQLEVGRISWCNHERCNVSTSDGLGAGLINTRNIISVHNSATTTNCAAYACSKYYTQTSKQGEWYLPSKIELDLLYRNLKDKIIATGSDGYHWSSSQGSGEHSWLQRFSDGDLRYGYGNSHSSSWGYLKNYTFSVRAVRAF